MAKVIQPMISRIVMTCRDDRDDIIAATNAYTYETISEDTPLAIWGDFPCLYKTLTITETNKIHKTNSRKTRRQLDIIGGGYV